MAATARELRATPLAGAAAQLAGVIWVLQWAHALVAHGPTQHNRAQLWLGMTWLDSAKLLALSYLLLVPAVLHVMRWLRESGDRAAGPLGRTAVAALAVCAVSTLLEFRVAVWGSYAGAFDPADRVTQIGGIVRAVASSLVLTAALVALTARAARRRALPYWLPPALGVGCLATVFIGGPLPPVPGLAWLLLGGWLLTQAPRSRPA